MFDLVLAVIIRLKMLNVKSIVGRTNSTEVKSMTNLEANTYSKLIIRHNNIFRCKNDTLIFSNCMSLTECVTLKKLLRVLLTIILTPSIC